MAARREAMHQAARTKTRHQSNREEITAKTRHRAGKKRIAARHGARHRVRQAAGGSFCVSCGG